MRWTVPAPKGSTCGVQVESRLPGRQARWVECGVGASVQFIDDDGNRLPPVCALHEARQRAAVERPR